MIMKHIKYDLFFLFLLAVFFSMASVPVSHAQTNQVSNFSYRDQNGSATEGIKLNVNKKKIVEKDSFELSVKGLKKKMKATFKVADSSILSLKDTSKKKTTVMGEKCGTTDIEVTIRAKRGFLYRTVKTLHCEVTVGPRAISIKLKKDKLTMRVGQKKKLKYILKPNNTAEKPVFKSSNPSCATVSSKGKIKAIEPGVARITVSIANGQSAVCTVTVKESQ